MMKPAFRARCLLVALLLAAPLGALAAPPFAFSSYPLFLAPAIKPNVMIILDNSESMDATMAGKVINGDDPATRGNIARGILRGVLSSYRDSFNFGITSFDAYGPSLYNTHAYYFGDATTMVYTNDCVNGISASNSGLRCIPNPQTGNGFGWITYDRSGDDADINDVLYSGWGAAQLYGIGTSGTSYNVWDTRDNTTNWGNFGNYYGNIQFTPTDAGFLPQAATMPRQLWIRRGWGYGDYITGGGRINEAVKPDSSSHFSTMVSLLGSETPYGSGEIKNNTFFTPIAGTLSTVRDYFRGGSTPITQSCQRNFVMLATDGNPTGRMDGSQYDPSEWQNTQTSPGVWSYGRAQRDVFDQLTALRSVSISSRTYDIQTYVVGMGDTLANASSVAALNQMANLGGGYPTAFVGSSADSLQAAFAAIVGDIQAKTSAASSVALNTGSWTTGSALYQAKFNSSDWSGTLLDYAVNGSGAISATATWDAGAQVKAQPWSTGRNILTYKPSAAAGLHGVPFRWPAAPATPNATELDVSQTAALQPELERRRRFIRRTAAALPARRREPGSAPLRLAAVRGTTVPQPRRTVRRSATSSTRRRTTSPRPISATTTTSRRRRLAPSSTPARMRTPVIYIERHNDDMLHTINANTSSKLLAYVPSPVIADLPKLTNLNYVHRYYVDGSPTVQDDHLLRRRLAHDAGFAGMRAGAKGLYALNVTDPCALHRGQLAHIIVRWDCPRRRHGLRLRAAAAGEDQQRPGAHPCGDERRLRRRRAQDGHTFLFVINAENGTLVAKIDAGSANAASPNGFLGIFSGDQHQRRRRRRHGLRGDLNGRNWKFDLFSTLPEARGSAEQQSCRCCSRRQATRSPAVPTSPIHQPAATSSPSAPAATSPPPTTPT